MDKFINTLLERPLPCPDRRPERFSTGERLALGAWHVVPADDVFTICRIVDYVCWYPLTRRENPEWQTWPTRAEVEAKLNENLLTLHKHPNWGC